MKTAKAGSQQAMAHVRDCGGQGGCSEPLTNLVFAADGGALPDAARCLPSLKFPCTNTNAKPSLPLPDPSQRLRPRSLTTTNHRYTSRGIVQTKNLVCHYTAHLGRGQTNTPDRLSSETSAIGSPPPWRTTKSWKRSERVWRRLFRRDGCIFFTNTRQEPTVSCTRPAT